MKSRLRSAIGAAGLMLASHGYAQNLVVDTSFATDITTGWTNFGSSTPADGTRTWTAEDVTAMPTSGSAEFSVATADVQIGLAQCISVTPGQTYKYYSRIKFPTGQTDGDTRAVMELAFYSDAACSTFLGRADGQGAVVGIAYSQSDSVWPGLPGNAGPTNEASVAAPASALSAQVRIYAERIAGTSGSGTIKFDQVVVHDASSTPVHLQHFDVE